MKKPIIVLLIASMVFGLFLAGCSEKKDNSEAISDTEIEGEDEAAAEANIDPLIIDQIVAEFEASFEDIDVDKDKIIEIYNDLDVDLEKDIAAQSDAEIMKDLGNVLKYKVSDLDYEGYENEVYDLSYFSETKWEDIAMYFHILLHATDEFNERAYPEEMGIGAVLKGTLFGMKTVVEITYDEDNEESYVVIFSRPLN